MNEKHENIRLIKTIKIILILISLLLISEGYSQSISWQKLYDHTLYDIGNDVCAGDNGNFYVVGSTRENYELAYVLKLNPYGDTIWTKIINTGAFLRTVVSSGDGGCVVSGYSGSNSAVKLDQNGNIVWQQFYGIQTAVTEDIYKTSDGGYIACGYRYFDPYVFKIDSTGNLQWQKFYPVSDLKDFNSIVEAPGGGYVIAGVVNDSTNDTMKILMLKINDTGAVVWDKRYKVNNTVAGGRKILRTDNGYLVGGGGGSLTGFVQVCFIRTDFDGNLFFSASIPSTKDEFFNDVKYLSPNKYVFSVNRDSGGFPNVYNAVGLLTDSNGNVLKKVKFNNQDDGYLGGILPLANGDIVFAGTFETYISGGHQDVYVVRTDSMLSTPPIGIIKNWQTIPVVFELYPAIPNPFNPQTKLKFEIPQESRVKLIIYDILGREVVKLVNEDLRSGEYSVSLNANILPSGIYFAKLTAFSKNTEYSKTQKLVLLK